MFRAPQEMGAEVAALMGQSAPVLSLPHHSFTQHQFGRQDRQAHLACWATAGQREGLIPELGKYLPNFCSSEGSLKEYEKHGEGNGNPLQYSCLEKSMDRGAWRAAVYGIT